MALIQSQSKEKYISPEGLLKTFSFQNFSFCNVNGEKGSEILFSELSSPFFRHPDGYRYLSLMLK